MMVLATTEREYPWGVLRSTNASKVKVVLEEKGLNYKLDRLSPGNLWKKPAEMLEKHPLGKVPYLETDADGIIYDSTVINEYLEDRYPEPSLRPADPCDAARMRMLENFADEAVLMGGLPLIWMPMWSKPEDRDVGKMEQGREHLRKWALPYMEDEIADRDYLCDVFTLADVPFMSMAMVLEVDNMDVGQFPNAEAYLNRLRTRNSYQAISPQTSLEDSAGNF